MALRWLSPHPPPPSQPPSPSSRWTINAVWKEKSSCVYVDPIECFRLHNRKKRRIVSPAGRKKDGSLDVTIIQGDTVQWRNASFSRTKVYEPFTLWQYEKIGCVAVCPPFRRAAAIKTCVTVIIHTARVLMSLSSTASILSLSFSLFSFCINSREDIPKMEGRESRSGYFLAI